MSLLNEYPLTVNDNVYLVIVMKFSHKIKIGPMDSLILFCR